jgi:hypothetical protein
VALLQFVSDGSNLKNVTRYHWGARAYKFADVATPSALWILEENAEVLTINHQLPT